MTNNKREKITIYIQMIFCFVDFDFFDTKILFFGFSVFSVFAISVATGGVNRKLQNHKKRKRQNQNFR